MPSLGDECQCTPCRQSNQLAAKDAEIARLKLIVRERTHRERGCICEGCVEDEYQTAKVIESLRQQIELLKDMVTRLAAALVEVDKKQG